MINRNNYRLIREYLSDRHGDDICIGSFKAEETQTRYILEWANEKPFIEAATIRPKLKEFIHTYRIDGKEKPLSDVYKKKIMACARRFFTWLADNKREYRNIQRGWISKLKTKKIDKYEHNLEYVTEDEILAIAHAPVVDIIERRAKALTCLLYVSGMRIGAAVTIPIGAINLSDLTIRQDPELGVRTKNSKKATTVLWDIPEVIKVIKDWDNEVRGVLGDEGLWFAPLSPDTGQIDKIIREAGYYRSSIARRNIKDWLGRVGLQYHSPHKFRHGHIRYGRDRAKTINDYKAVSQNVMHETMDITDRHYSRMTEDEIKRVLSNLGNKEGNISVSVPDLLCGLEYVVNQLKTINKHAPNDNSQD